MSTDEPADPVPTSSATDPTENALEGGVGVAPAQGPARRVWRGALREFLETVALALILFLAIRTFVMNYRVVGHSMEPNIQDGQYLFIDKLLYSWGTPWRGDVIVLRPPDVPGEIYLKRVIALPGDTVQLRGGLVLLNGQVIDEPWNPRVSQQSQWGPAKVSDGELFVLGDNLPGSRDSRYFGMLKREQVVGRAFLCYWPPSKWVFYRRYGE